MNIVDICIIVVAIIGIAVGAKKGIIEQSCLFLTIIVGLLLAAWLSGPLSRIVSKLVVNTEIALLLSYGIIFIGVSICFFIIAGIMKRRAEEKGTKVWDHLLGGLMGAFTGVVICGAVLMGITNIASERIESGISKSQFAPPILSFVSHLGGVIPQAYRENIRRIFPERPAVIDKAADGISELVDGNSED